MVQVLKKKAFNTQNYFKALIIMMVKLSKQFYLYLMKIGLNQEMIPLNR
jgi:hypothetical protein